MDADETAALLRRVLAWELPPDGWEEVEALLDRIARPRGPGDPFDAVVELELAAPRRITRIGDEPTVPAEPRIRLRIKDLVHSLTGEPGDDDD